MIIDGIHVTEAERLRITSDMETEHEAVKEAVEVTDAPWLGKAAAAAAGSHCEKQTDVK